MKYKTTNEYSENINKDLLNILLGSRGVKDVNHLLNVSIDDCHSYKLLDNIIEGAEGYIWHVKNGSNIVNLVDCDYDGNSSSAELNNYTLKNLNYKCDYIIHEHKNHGIDMDELRKYGIEKIDLLVMTDGGTSDIKEMNELLEINPNIQFLVIDHHKPDLEKDETLEDFLDRNPALIINPETCDYPNGNLAGVAVVYKFCQCLDGLLEINDADNYLDLVATGLIADSMDLRDYESRYLALKGIEMLEKDSIRVEQGKPILGNHFLRTIIESKKNRDLKFITIHSIGWSLAPLINGTVRMGTMEQKTDMYRAFCNETEEGLMYQPRRQNGAGKDSPKPDPIPITLQQSALKKCTSAKGKQDRKVAKYYIELIERINYKNLADNKVLIIDSSDTIPEKTLTGLVANKISNDYKRPAIVLKKVKKGLYGGSCRNFDKSPVASILKLVNSTELAKCAGHDNACGFRSKTKNLVPLRDLLNDQLKDMKYEDVHHVEYEIPVGRLRKRDIMGVGRLFRMWGNGLPVPLFAITNVTMNVGDMGLMGDKKNIIKFKKADHDFIKFMSGSDELDKMTMRIRKGFGRSPARVTLDLICEMQINEWNNGFETREYPQLVIVDYNVREAAKATF